MKKKANPHKPADQKMSRCAVKTETKVPSTAPPSSLIPHPSSLRWWPLVVIGLAALFVYLNALGNDFAYDDSVQIKKNPYITSFKYLGDIFTKNVWAFRGREGIS